MSYTYLDYQQKIMCLTHTTYIHISRFSKSRNLPFLFLEGTTYDVSLNEFIEVKKSLLLLLVLILQLLVLKQQRDGEGKKEQ